MTSPPRRHPLVMACCWYLVVFLILFPKGGIKLGQLPLTWGYLFLAGSTLPLLVIRLVALPFRPTRRLLAALLIQLPMQILFVYAFVFYGFLNASFTFSTFVGLFALPWIFLLIYPPFLRFVDGAKLASYFRWCVFLAAAWGILLFFVHPLTGHFIEVPYLTVNAQDYGELENTKNIARGLFFKLISTYNNGNLYGVATLILLPLYSTLEPSRWRRGVLKVALLLTLSRTVWVGLVLNELFPLVLQLARQIPTFPIVYLRSVFRRLIAVGFTIALVFGALLFNTSHLGMLGFLFDTTAGGRTGEIPQVSSLTFLPSQPIYGFSEILYGSAATGWGIVGFFAFLAIMLSPVLLLAVDRTALQSPTRRAAFRGLMLYAVLAASDGAFDFIPVMAFYWFVYMIYIFGWPGTAVVPSRRRQPEQAVVPRPVGTPQALLPSLPSSTEAAGA